MRRFKDYVKDWTLRDWLLWLGIAGAFVALGVQVFLAARRG